MTANGVTVIGGGLAGCEAAFRLANMGIPVELFEMRPHKMTPAHKTGLLAELVCSNSLKSEAESTAQGVLKKEMRKLDSIVLSCADKCRVSAGQALAVDREMLGSMITEIITGHGMINVVNQEMGEIPDDRIAIVSSGPLTSDRLSEAISVLTGQENLFFFDAVAPIIAKDSIDFTKVYYGSRYGKGEADYINCPMSEDEYRRFHQALIEADSVPYDSIDEGVYFSACVPVEVMGRRGTDTLRYGPMRPVGLPEPVSGKVPYAVVQLRSEDREGTMVSPVGFQTRMKWGEQERVIRMIPGLENACFLRLGVMHRNTYINSPRLIDATLQFRSRPQLFFAGQILGVEGYMESAATGIVAGINAGRIYKGLEPLVLPAETMLGSLTRYVSNPSLDNFQPMNSNFGLLPPMETRIRKKADRNLALSNRSWDKICEFSEALVN